MSDRKQGKEPNGFEEHVPSGKNDRGPSMKERLIAQRRAEAEAQATGKAPAPAPKAAPAKPVQAAKPAQPVRPAAARPVAKAAEAESAGEAPKPARGARTSSAGSRSSARAGSSKRRGRETEDGAEEGEGGGRRRGAKPKEKNKLVPILGVVGVLAIAGVGTWKIMGGKDTEASDKEIPNPTDASMSDANSESADQAAADAAVAKAAEDQKAKADAKKAEADAKAAKAAEANAAEAADSGTPQVKRKNGRQQLLKSVPDDLYDPNDPAEPQLASYEPFGQPDGCSAEMWREIQDKVATMLDPDGGAAGTRAAKSLEKDYGRFAFPALVNGLLALDLTEEAGHLTGDFVQRTMMNLANGRSVDWSYDFKDMPNLATIANRRAIAVLYDQWGMVVKDPAYWDKYANSTEAAKRNKAGGSGDEAPAAPPEEKPNDAVNDLLDDLDE